jgi:hypothetical protein
MIECVEIRRPSYRNPEKAKVVFDTICELRRILVKEIPEDERRRIRLQLEKDTIRS